MLAERTTPNTNKTRHDKSVDRVRSISPIGIHHHVEA